MNLTKRLPLALSIASAIALACLTVYQSGLISDITKQLTWTKDKLTKTTDALEAEMGINQQLEQELTVYQDSVNLMNQVIKDLNGKITGLKNNVRRLNSQLKRSEDKVVALTKEIGRLKSKSSVDEQKIAALEKKRDAILHQMEINDRQRMEDKKEQARLNNRLSDETSAVSEMKDNILDIESDISTSLSSSGGELGTEQVRPVEEKTKVILKPQMRLTSIVSNTTVNFNKIVLRNKEYGKDLNKIKSGWKFSFLDFDLLNQDAGAIIDQQFLIQIYDLDNQKVVPINEYNPEYPDSQQGAIGYIFRYEGQPMSIRYFNSQRKEGSNFDVRLFYYKDNMVYQLRNGIIPLVRGGYVVTGK